MRQRYKGVKGWLLLFCIILTVINPLITVFNLVGGYNESKAYFAAYPGLQTLFAIDSVLSIGLVAFSIFAGISLWMIRPNAVKIAKIWLFSFLAYSILIIFLPYAAGLPSSALNDMIGQVIVETIRSLVFFGIWFSYLLVSTRVRQTYGVPEPSQE